MDKLKTGYTLWNTADGRVQYFKNPKDTPLEFESTGWSAIPVAPNALIDFLKDKYFKNYITNSFGDLAILKGLKGSNFSKETVSFHVQEKMGILTKKAMTESNISVVKMLKSIYLDQ